MPSPSPDALDQRERLFGPTLVVELQRLFERNDGRTDTHGVHEADHLRKPHVDVALEPRLHHLGVFFPAEDPVELQAEVEALDVVRCSRAHRAIEPVDQLLGNRPRANPLGDAVHRLGQHFLRTLLGQLDELRESALLVVHPAAEDVASLVSCPQRLPAGRAPRRAPRAPPGRPGGSRPRRARPAGPRPAPVPPRPRGREPSAVACAPWRSGA